VTTIARSWICCEPIVAHGPIRGSWRQRYLLHVPECSRPLFRRQTITQWIEVPVKEQ
jgi:hypothetical protein